MNKPWINEDRKRMALYHKRDMWDTYRKEIYNSIQQSTYTRYEVDGINEMYVSGNIPTITLEEISSSDAAIKYGGPKTALLNFASYKWPGGGFIIGAIAQEEAICHDSTLYNVIGNKKFAPLYEYNRMNADNTLYDNFAIYSPAILFEDRMKNVYFCDVITCAAPNLSKWSGSKSFAEAVMSDRIKFVLDVAQNAGVKTLILGAFGCGVFKNDPIFVAETFNKYLQTGKYSFENVVFAIPGGPNFTAFSNVFQK